tara:strand:+ start:3071 stop:4564 length:1494 start_codon:yes stop_codon:yes gene_type:complete
MSLNSQILTITEPSIGIEPMKMPNLGEREGGGGNYSGFQGGVTPYVRVNGFTFQEGSIIKLNLNSTSRYPELNIQLLDNQDNFTVDRFPRDGDILSLRIEIDKSSTYKDIRMDFTILEFRGVPTSTFEKSRGEAMFNVRAVAKLPGLYTDHVTAYPENTSFEHIKSVASELQLGLASNVIETNDRMTRVCAQQSKLEFLSNTIAHSYVSDDAFQTYCIDPYYYINFVDLQKVFNGDDQIDTTDMLTTQMWDERDGDPTVGRGEEQAQFILTNHHLREGTKTYISSFNLVNNSTKIALENGYRRSMQYFDVNTDEDQNLYEFDIESLVSDNIGDREEALKGRRNYENDEYESHVKHKYMGIQSESTHENYKYAYINNVQNLVELDKMNLVVNLTGIHPAITRYMKVPVYIYNYSSTNTETTKEINKQAREGDFETKNEELGNKTDLDNGDSPVIFTIDEFLTSHYVVMGIEYKFNETDGFNQVLHLSRREWPARLNNV